MRQQNKNTSLLIKSEFIYNSADVNFPSCHASTIVETPDGLLTAWFGGTHEKNPDVGIWVARKLNGGDWKFIPPTDLPADFAKIPESSDISDVRYSVAGTQEGAPKKNLNGT